ncbi:MAG: phosphatidylglycerophosphatase A [Opitutales bacterium]|jgi:phosphatidylglycerophosphatase A
MLNKIKVLFRVFPDRAVTGVCTCGPIGYWGKAPGTNGTVAGLALYTVLFFPLGTFGEIVLATLLALLGWLFCDEGERRLQKRDPGEIILDEVVAVPFCFIGLKTQMVTSGHAWIYLLAGFALFRLFDILKPFGINRLQRYPGGLGVVLDDLAAAVAVNLSLRLLALGLSLGSL